MNAEAYTYDDFPEEEAVPEVTGQELMELDGLLPVLCHFALKILIFD